DPDADEGATLPEAGGDPSPAGPEAPEASATGPAHQAAPRPRQAPADPAAAARLMGIPTPLARIEVTVAVEVGRTRMPLAELVSVEPGALVSLDRMADSPVDILVNGKPFARGEIVAIGEQFGVRITDLCDPGDAA
ncbi:MAG: flagellar motor switch protein FliN, partial [Sphingomonadaceae bacterium]